MPLYRYSATDDRGALHRGEQSASSEAGLAAALAGRGLTLVEASDRLESGGGGRLGPGEAAELTRQLAGLTGSGRALPGGLRALAEEMENRSIRRVLSTLADEVEQGRPLDEALDHLGSRVPDSLRGIIRAAGRSGKVAEILGESARLQQLGIELRRRLWTSLAYPMVLLAFFLLIFYFVAFYVIADFENIYADFGVNLPWTTIVLIRAARFAREFGLAVGGALLAIGLGVLVANWASGGRLGRPLVSRLPVLGAVWKSTAMAEFCHLLSLLMEAGVPLAEALPMAGGATRDPDLAWGGRAAAAGVVAGELLPRAVARAGVFPNGFARLIDWAEGGGSLPGALRVAGALFEARARPQARAAGAVFTVIVVMMVLFGVGFMIAALYMPLIQLISELSG
jgi:type II secretory pathway component PulF